MATRKDKKTRRHTARHSREMVYDASINLANRALKECEGRGYESVVALLSAAARICYDDGNNQSRFLEMAKDEFACIKEVLAAEARS